MITLLHGPWDRVLAGVEADSVITDPPFSPKTHNGQRHGRKDERYGVKNVSRLSHRGIGYAPWTIDDAHRFVAHWTQRTRRWICVFTSHDFVVALQDFFASFGFTPFAPISCVMMHRNVRLAGDGPANWTDHLVVARPRRLRRWRALPGAYVGKPFDVGENMLDRSKRIVAGAKPRWLMREIIGHYSLEGDHVVDAFAGGATTGLACADLGRDCTLAELKGSTCRRAQLRLDRDAAVQRVNAPQLRRAA